jgi:very-short-patch-repair endonuclease
MDAKGASADLRVATTAARQHGVLSTAQLHAAGMSRNAVRRRVEAGRLHRVHRGVYAVGHAGLSPEGKWMAAILASGTVAANDEAPTVLARWGATVSHVSAAQLWGLLPVRNGPVDVCVPGYGGRKRRLGIRLHRSTSLSPAVVTLRRGIPSTTAARTIDDLRRSVSGRNRLISPKEMRHAIRQAEVLGLRLGADRKSDRTRSDLERDFLRLCRRRRLPLPEVNVRIGPYLVDFLWRESMLVVETDGYVYHRGRGAFEDDRARDLALRGRGYEVVRLGGKLVADEPGQVARVLGSMLARRSSPQRAG